MNGFKVTQNENEIFDFLIENNALKILKRFDENKNVDAFAFFKTQKLNCCLIKAAADDDSGLILITNKNENKMNNYAIQLLKTQGLNKDKLVYEKL